MTVKVKRRCGVSYRIADDNVIPHVKIRVKPLETKKVVVRRVDSVADMQTRQNRPKSRWETREIREKSMHWDHSWR